MVVSVQLVKPRDFRYRDFRSSHDFGYRESIFSPVPVESNNRVNMPARRASGGGVVRGKQLLNETFGLLLPRFSKDYRLRLSMRIQNITLLVKPAQ